MLGVELRGMPLGDVSIFSGSLVSLGGGDDFRSVLEASDTDGNVMGFARGVLGVLGRTILVTRLAVRRMDCLTFHCRFLATKKSTVVAAIEC